MLNLVEKYTTEEAIDTDDGVVAIEYVVVASAVVFGLVAIFGLFGTTLLTKLDKHHRRHQGLTDRIGGRATSPLRAIALMRHPLTLDRETREDRGAVAIELVMALPALLMLIIGTVVLGNFLSVKTQTINLAREGARAAALSKSLPEPTLTAIVGPPCANPSDPDDDVTVQATMVVELRNIPFLPTVLPDTITETVTMRCGG